MIGPAEIAKPVRPAPRASLSVAAAQPSTSVGDVAANVAAHVAVVGRARARVVVFPELSLTGYQHGAPLVETQDPVLAPLVAACARAGCVALVGAPVAGGRGRSIGVLRVDGSGVEVVYRKVHLGGEEPDHWVPGDRPGAVEVAGWRFGLAVCRDTGVPAHADATHALGIDAYVAGVVTAAADAEEVPDRATETARRLRLWVVVASHAGPTGGGFETTAGGSGVWDPSGAVVSRAGPRPGELVRAVLVDGIRRRAAGWSGGSG